MIPHLSICVCHVFVNYISGLDNAGKTTILKRVTGGDVNSVSPTLGFNIMSLVRGEYTLNVCAYLTAKDFMLQSF